MSDLWPEPSKEIKVGDIITVYWREKLIKAEVIGFKHGIPNIKPIDKT